MVRMASVYRANLGASVVVARDLIARRDYVGCRRMRWMGRAEQSICAVPLELDGVNIGFQ